jgi:hypothetical protein
LFTVKARSRIRSAILDHKPAILKSNALLFSYSMDNLQNF